VLSRAQDGPLTVSPGCQAKDKAQAKAEAAEGGDEAAEGEAAEEEPAGEANEEEAKEEEGTG
jgi:hypothetical protein